MKQSIYASIHLHQFVSPSICYLTICQNNGQTKYPTIHLSNFPSTSFSPVPALSGGVQMPNTYSRLKVHREMFSPRSPFLSRYEGRINHPGSSAVLLNINNDDSICIPLDSHMLKQIHHMPACVCGLSSRPDSSATPPYESPNPLILAESLSYSLSCTTALSPLGSLHLKPDALQRLCKLLLQPLPVLVVVTSIHLILCTQHGC